jgi:hypothetical protein
MSYADSSAQQGRGNGDGDGSDGYYQLKQNGSVSPLDWIDSYGNYLPVSSPGTEATTTTAEVAAKA